MHRKERAYPDARVISTIKRQFRRRKLSLLVGLLIVDIVTQIRLYFLVKALRTSIGLRVVYGA